MRQVIQVVKNECTLVRTRTRTSHALSADAGTSSRFKDPRRIIANIERKKDNGIDVYYVLVLKDAGISSGTILSSLGARLHAKNEETD